MTALRYLCLSDLHLGAGYSLLTGCDACGHPEPGAGTDTLRLLGQALARTLPQLSDGTPPTLVLLGDVLDMGQSPLGLVSQAYRRFLRDVVLAGGDRPLFAPRVLLVPGNHDHHLWRVAQDHAYLRHLDAGQVDNDVLQHTRLFEDAAVPRIPSDLLTKLSRCEPALGDTTVDIVYPNLGLLDAARRRCVVLHHGHYVDPTYRVMSMLNLAGQPRVPGTPPPPLTVGQIEAQNGAWVDFLWSDLGSAGATGATATTLYEVMRDSGESHKFSLHLAKLLVRRVGGALGVAATMPVVKGVTFEELARGLVDVTLGQGAQSQRDDYLQLTSDTDRAQLRWYLSGALHQQMRHEQVAPEGLELSFVYGHTHKPYQDELPVQGFDRPVAVYNTGGWVMDQPTMTTTQGAAAVLIDDALNVASLRLFNDPVNGSSPAVHAAGTGGWRDRDNPLLAALAGALERTRDDWSAFTRATVGAAERHANELLDDFFGQRARQALRQQVHQEARKP